MIVLKFLLFSFALIFNAQVGSTEYTPPRDLGSFDLEHAAFVEIFKWDEPAATVAEQYVLFISTFNYLSFFSTDPVYKLNFPGKYLDDVPNWRSRLELVGEKSTAYWPNNPTELDTEIAGFNGMIQTSGFLVPTKTYGQLEVYNLDTKEGPWNMASEETGLDWSYHWVVWTDIDGDGLKDALTARFHVGTFGGTTSQVVYLKNPGGLTGTAESWSGWKETVLIEGGLDVYFNLLTLTNNAGEEFSVLVGGELWTERVVLYYVPNVPGAWLNPDNIKSVVIDDTLGQPFEASMEDINADGRLEILASAYDSNEDVGNLYLYVMPDDWTTPWERKLIATGFKANNYLLGNSMTPGKHRIFYPSDEYAAQTTEEGLPVKPWISLSGDDDGKHYILYPVNEDKNDWTYEKHLIIETDETTSGTMALVDLDGDGYIEIVSAGYTVGKVYVHTFAPQA